MTLGSHQTTVGKSQTHFTPRFILDALGSFDLDPCAGDPRPWDCAANNYTEADDGLSTPWQIADHFASGRLCKCSCHYTAPSADRTNPQPNLRRAATLGANADSPASAENASAARSASAIEVPTTTTTESSGRDSSKTIESASRRGTVDALSAGRLSPQTQIISHLEENTSQAGACSVFGSTPPTACDSDVPTPEKRSGSETPAAAMHYPIGDARPNESELVSTISGGGVIKPESHSIGSQRIGHLAFDGGNTAAPIATRTGRSRKTTSSRYPRQDVLEQSQETSSQLAHPAILPSGQEIHSHGSRISSDSIGSCPICAALGCQWIENPKPRIWLNPPFHRYGVGRWIERLADHGQGTALLHARTETAWFQPIWRGASAILFLSERVIFCKADGSPQTISNPDSKHYGKPANSGAPVVLAAFGRTDAELLATSCLGGAMVTDWTWRAAA